jgi:hypothetical protein
MDGRQNGKSAPAIDADGAISFCVRVTHGRRTRAGLWSGVELNRTGFALPPNEFRALQAQ